VLADGYEIRALERGDGAALAAAYRRNRAHLAPTGPDRPESFYTDAGQEAEVERNVKLAEQGATYLWLTWYGGRVVGRLMLNNIARAILQSGTIGYWVDHEHLGKGLATAAVEHAAREAARLGLHRLEAGTIVDNLASQAVLRRSGFTEIGTAERFLFVRGEWRDHILFQRILSDDPPGNPATGPGVARP
jgi:ribosomal-protein-alanine N-acetyltransferase